MTVPRETWTYKHVTDHGVLDVTVPDKVSEDDVVDMEEYFALIIRQCKRRQIRKPTDCIV